MGGAATGTLIDSLLVEILRDAHGYVPGIEPERPSRTGRPFSLPERLATLSREHGRDLVERTASRAGFARRHFDPVLAASRLAEVVRMADGLQETYSMLADEHSRRALIDVLKLRVLGPYHAALAITPQMFRSRQAFAERELLVERDTFEVSDPWFTPLSLYRVAVNGAPPITLHGHSVDVTSVFLLHQYRYSRGPLGVRAEPGDVVLDVGGCWGDTALYFASLVGARGKVYTFEFDPESLEVLRANLDLNPELAGRIEVIERALWDSSDESLPFIQAGRMTTLMDAERNLDVLHARTITLDDFIDRAQIDRIGFVKMDAERAELEVLAGARETLLRFAPKLAIAAYHKEDDLVRIPRALESVRPDYRLYLDTFSPVEEETVLFATVVNSST